MNWGEIINRHLAYNFARAHPYGCAFLLTTLSGRIDMQKTKPLFRVAIHFAVCPTFVSKDYSKRMKMNKQNNLPFFQPEEENVFKSLFEQNERFEKVISRYAEQYGVGNVIHVDELGDEIWQPVTAGINSLHVPDDVQQQFSGYCLRQNLPVVYPINMEWGAAVIVSDNNSPINIARKTKTGNYNDDIRTYVGRYISFWSHQTVV